MRQSKMWCRVCSIASPFRQRSFYLATRCYSSVSTEQTSKPATAQKPTSKLKDGPPLEHFIANSFGQQGASLEIEEPSVSYINKDDLKGHGKKVYFETYGCQMNVNDTEIACAILEKSGYTKTTEIMESDAVLIMTCSIREGAEQKIWRRLDGLKKTQTHIRNKHKYRAPFKIGILGCMAENLKKKILEKEKAIDIICGPDAYRDLPHMLAATAESDQAAVNVQLSLEETYADVMPVRVNPHARTAFVSIMRGCDNMCSYCIVPFTRGRERSRPIDSIVQEIEALSQQGVKEVTLLGQNVNSYRDTSSSTAFSAPQPDATSMARGFSTVYKPKVGGRRFSDLLDKVSLVDPEMRIRFTSPHPKDFPDEVLHLVRERINICTQLHMPAQSGSTRVLEAMRRGYSRESYLDLIDRVRHILPDVSLSSDFIAGFCGETEEDHEQTLDLISRVKYESAFTFPYSMRGKTRAFHKLADDVPEDVKKRRHAELHAAYFRESLALKQAQVGQIQLVLIEGDSKRSQEHWQGRNDGNIKVIFPKIELERLGQEGTPQQAAVGEYVAVEITDCSVIVLQGRPLYRTSLSRFHAQQPASTADLASLTAS